MFATIGVSTQAQLAATLSRMRPGAAQKRLGVIARPAAGVSGHVKTEARYTKSNLPEKACQACGRPFAWRKKWRASWAEVKTCSERCKAQLRQQGRRS